ncbi:hypothetical protein A3C17_04140 [Candidatus Uhrbacteria bacterium RIFCSPHIGHO2_02_FULL_53_13]|uniref:PDZ domain-containing protein n=2 Tax=Candidatus Uhriibacteriota TaxID=1752732 RepID=A0A1F7TXT6_9BACT|nr:MAG: hypothetical protein A3C17_04140 [Candidatus Uhrbacteria bacterium RIFCSPHIGHO2_02_FULL_53_13]OGL89899.1 MAG: hypothetical protein A3I45_00825 [Candidatus Uhrbacteria bacterium RIFCSPLOWO2_02_FULL_53_10]
MLPFLAKIKQQQPIVWAVAGLVVTAVFSVGFAVGRTQTQSVVLEDGSVIGLKEVRERANDVEFALFWEVWDMLQNDYLRGPVPEKDLFYGAVNGLVDGLNDPYSEFFDPREADVFESDLEGKFEGIGAEIGIRENQLVIVSPLVDSPAEHAGIQAGDKIYFIDDVDTAEMSVDEAVRLIRGPRGSTVVLTVSHNGIETVEEISIVRDVIRIDSVTWEVTDDGVAVIRIAFFNADTAALFNRAVVELMQEDVSGIVLDLRNNPGGFLDRAVSVAGEWIGNDTVVIERNENGDLERFPSTGVGRLQRIPTLVLVNGGTASASEIVAGALQDYGFATILGEQTFGKGSVQEYRELADGSAVKITISEWLTPLERSIDQNGIAPDVEIVFDLEAYKEGIDVQLEAALNALKSNAYGDPS